MKYVEIKQRFFTGHYLLGKHIYVITIQLHKILNSFKHALYFISHKTINTNNRRIKIFETALKEDHLARLQL